MEKTSAYKKTKHIRPNIVGCGFACLLSVLGCFQLSAQSAGTVEGGWEVLDKFASVTLYMRQKPLRVVDKTAVIVKIENAGELATGVSYTPAYRCKANDAPTILEDRELLLAPGESVLRTFDICQSGDTLSFWIEKLSTAN